VIYSTGLGALPICVIVNDFNNGRNPDIAVADFLTNNIVIFFRFIDGSYLSGIAYSTGIESSLYGLTTWLWLIMG
jgi:hypothetical protein